MDDLALSLRHVALKKGESALAALGVALAVAVVASTVSLIGAYGAAWERFSRQPQSLQIQAVGAFRTLGEGEAAVRIDASSGAPVRMELSDGLEALAEDPNLLASYTARFMRFATAAAPAWGPGAGAGGPPGEPPDAAGPEAAASPEAAAVPGTPSAEAAAAVSPADEALLESVQGFMVSPSYFDAYDLRAAEGALFDDRDVSARNAVAAVGSSLAKKLFADGKAFGKRIRLNGTVYAINAVLEPYAYGSEGLSASFDDLVFVPARTNVRGGPGGGFMGGADELSFAVKAGSDPAAAARGLEAFFARKYGEGKIVARTSAAELKKEIDKRSRILGLLALLASAVGVASGVNVFNLMAGRVSRRTAGIAVQRSLGATAGRIFRQVMLEAGLLAAAGAVLGAAAAPAIAAGLASALEAAGEGALSVAPRLDLVALSAGCAVLAALAFAALPAAAAAGTSIVDALRDE